MVERLSECLFKKKKNLWHPPTTTACLPKSWYREVSGLITYRFSYLRLVYPDYMVLHNVAPLLLGALPHEHLGQGLFTHSIGKETEAHRVWVIKVKIRVGLESKSFF